MTVKPEKHLAAVWTCFNKFMKHRVVEMAKGDAKKWIVLQKRRPSM